MKLFVLLLLYEILTVYDAKGIKAILKVRHSGGMAVVICTFGGVFC